MVITLPSLITQLNEARERYLDLVKQAQNSSTADEYNTQIKILSNVEMTSLFSNVDQRGKFIKCRVGFAQGSSNSSYGPAAASQANQTNACRCVHWNDYNLVWSDSLPSKSVVNFVRWSFNNIGFIPVMNIN